VKRIELLRSARVKKKRNMTPKKIVRWPSVEPAAEVAQRVEYVGSAEHKSHPSPAGPPKLRHNDASSCDPRYVDRSADQLVYAPGPTNALREAIASERTSDLVGAFPKYVWGVLDGELYEARLVNHERGQYKAYTLKDDAELPEDPDGKLQGIVPWRD
jgi:hypothetical protein